MTITFSFADGTPILFRSGLPLHYAGTKVFGAESMFFSDEEGVIVVQETVHYGTIIRLVDVSWHSSKRLRFNHDSTGLHLHIILRGHNDGTIKGAGDFNLDTDEFIALAANRWTGFISGGKDSVIVELIFPDAIPQPTHPSIPTLLTPPYKQLTTREQFLVRHLLSLLSDPYAVAGRIRQTLDEICQAIKTSLASPFVSDVGLRPSDTRLFLAMRDYLLQLTTAPALDALAKKFNTNTYKIKKYFPLLFGRSVLHFWQYHRCLVARERILQSGEILYAIYREAGYDHLSSFITGFNLPLGCNPGELLRNKWNLDAVKRRKKN